MIVALPLPRVAAVDVYDPLVNVTEPVGVGMPLPPLTATDTERGCAVVMLDQGGFTATTGVSFVTVTEAMPEAPL